MTDRITIVSADGHVGCPYKNYRPYMDPAYRDRIDDLSGEDRVLQESMAVLRPALMMSPGFIEFKQPDTFEVLDSKGRTHVGPYMAVYSDAKTRLAQLDSEGFAAEVLLCGPERIPPFFHEMNSPHPANLRTAGARAYHRWLADMASEGDGRLLPNAYALPSIDIKAMVDELHWVKKHGFVSVEIPQFVADDSLPPLYSRFYEPFWSACEELGLVLSAHAGWGTAQGHVLDALRQGAAAVKAGLGSMEGDGMMIHGDAEQESPFSVDLGPKQALWQLMMSGVFDRHPALKMTLTEVRADWVPVTLAYLDKQFSQHAPPVKLKPSEYWLRHCGVTPSSPKREEVEARHEIGIDQFMFGSDMPHPEGTWPNTRQWIPHAFHGVPESEVRKMLGENAIRIFNLDRSRLAKVAARIGPTPAEVFAGVDLDERTLENFTRRGGYQAPPVPVNIGKIDKALGADFGLVRNVSTA